MWLTVWPNSRAWDWSRWVKRSDAAVSCRLRRLRRQRRQQAHDEDHQRARGQQQQLIQPQPADGRHVGQLARFQGGDEGVRGVGLWQPERSRHPGGRWSPPGRAVSSREWVPVYSGGGGGVASGASGDSSEPSGAGARRVFVRDKGTPGGARVGNTRAGRRGLYLTSSLTRGVRLPAPSPRSAPPPGPLATGQSWNGGHGGAMEGPWMSSAHCRVAPPGPERGTANTGLRRVLESEARVRSIGASHFPFRGPPRVSRPRLIKKTPRRFRSPESSSSASTI